MGKIFVADGHSEWMHSHAANPMPVHLSDDIFRIYFSPRDHQRRSSIGFIELDLNRPDQVLRVSERPVLTPGQPGLFDDSGTSLACIANIDGKQYLYYLGWNLAVTVPWRNSIGLAIYDPATDLYRKFSQAPIVDRSAIDPYSISYPFVAQDEGEIRMWYGSNQSWGPQQSDMQHVIKYARSKDGVVWEREGIVAINLKEEKEYALSKPCVIRDFGVYKMWYSYRGQSYRMGYAESSDGIHWIRKDDQVGIDISATGWDSEMICYGFVFDHCGQRYMLYNGNGYGQTGFGLAVWEDQ